jgi:hypothetical protein
MLHPKYLIALILRVIRCSETVAGRNKPIAPILAAALVLLCAAGSTDGAHAQADGWRLLRSTNPRGGADVISMGHIADHTRSDLDLAGLMLQCGEEQPEVVIVVITPFPPHAQPSVTIGANGKEWKFEARVLSPGAELQLSAAAVVLAGGVWQAAHELTVKVTEREQSFGGVISIDGLGAALAALAANCQVAIGPPR